MNDTKDTPWDSMFIKSEVRAATITPRDPQDRIDTGLRKYAHLVRRQLNIHDTLTFQENLEYIHDWTAREMLGLIIEGVQLHEVSFDFLEGWRKTYQVPPDNHHETLYP